MWLLIDESADQSKLYMERLHDNLGLWIRGHRTSQSHDPAK